MIRKNQKLNKNGSALIYVLIAASAMTLIGFFMASRQISRAIQSDRERIIAGRNNVLKLMDLYTGDVNALRNSRVLLGGGFDGTNRFINCLYDGDDEGGRAEPNCVARVAGVQQRYEYALYVPFPLNPNPDLTLPITLYPPSGSAILAGGSASNTAAIALYDASGKRCPSTVTVGSRLCPIQVVTEFEPICPSATDSCNEAREMVLFYSVRPSTPASDNTVVKFKTIDNQGLSDSKRKPFRLKEEILAQIKSNI